ncbi:MAG: hypothetical protein ACOH5I_05675 [Oligoflexus sp.]
MRLRLACLLWILAVSGNVHGQERDLSLPAEFEAIGDRGLGLNNMATAGLPGPGATRINPALLAFDREYTVSGAYHWAPTGRDFYQLGVVDGSTANFSAGILYTGFQDSYRRSDFLSERDSPAQKRASLGIAFPLAQVSLGLAGHYVEAEEEDGFQAKGVKSVALGVGVAGLLTPTLRFGLSVENINNRRIAAFAPRIYRAGLDWAPFGDDYHFFLDYRQRERIDELEGAINPIPGLPLDPAQLAGYDEPEQMAFAGAQVSMYNVLRMTASYGHAFSSDERRSLAASVGLFQKGFSLTYSIARPYLDRKDQLNAISLTMLMKM